MSGAEPLPLLASQNLTAILRPLQWLVVVLIFLFFLRVVRAVFVETRPAGPRQTRRERRAARVQAHRAAPEPKPQKSLRLEVLEPPEYQGVLYELDDELTVGRSPGCGIPTTYDSYSSSSHARLFRRSGQLWVEDLGSTNGTFVNSERLAKPSRLSKGDLLQIGATVFEVVK